MTCIFARHAPFGDRGDGRSRLLPLHKARTERRDCDFQLLRSLDALRTRYILPSDYASVVLLGTSESCMPFLDDRWGDGVGDLCPAFPSTDSHELGVTPQGFHGR